MIAASATARQLDTALVAGYAGVEIMRRLIGVAQLPVGCGIEMKRALLERSRTLVQRAAHGATLLLPVMQSELNAVGERAGLIHLRGLDVETVTAEGAGRSARDYLALAGAVAVLAFAIALRLSR